MGKLGFYFEQKKCVGCRTCQVACKDKNRLEIGEILREVTTYETGEYPNARSYHYSASCNHCETPACMSACAPGAIYKAEDGAVLLDEELCDGCGKCVEFCPYQHPIMTAKGVAAKCDSCKPFRDKGQNPACVDSCAMRALHFGDLEELKKQYGEDTVCDLPILPASDMTKPSLAVSAKECAKEEEYRVVPI